MPVVSAAACYSVDGVPHHGFAQLQASAVAPLLPPPRSYYVVSWVPRALPEVVQLVKDIPCEEERSMINKHFELGMLVMRRCGVQNPEEIKCLLDGFREGTTRLSSKHARNCTRDVRDCKEYWSGVSVERRKLLIFFNDHRASRPWVLCPAKHCIKSARTTGKVKGRVKIFQYDRRTATIEIPRLFLNCLQEFMTRDHYVFATFCPQQKYTDHELDWFDVGAGDRQSENGTYCGGDCIFEDLLEDHDTKNNRLWPFDDYIIFANSQSKIVAVFKKKQPLLTLYRHHFGAGRGTGTSSVSTSASASSNSLDTHSEEIKQGEINSTAVDNIGGTGVPAITTAANLKETQPNFDECAAAVAQEGSIVTRRKRRNSAVNIATDNSCSHFGSDDDSNDGDSDYEVSGSRYRLSRRSTKRSRLACAAGNINSSVSQFSSTVREPIKKFEQSVFGLGDSHFHGPPMEQVAQADEAERILVRIMASVLAQLEPLEGGRPPQVFANMDARSQMQPPPSIPSGSGGTGSLNEFGASKENPMQIDAGAVAFPNSCGPPSRCNGADTKEPDASNVDHEIDYRDRKTQVSFPSPNGTMLYHDMIRHFLARVSYGLDHPPVPQKRIPDTVKRVVTKIITDNIKPLNLALLTAAFQPPDGRSFDENQMALMPAAMVALDVAATAGFGNGGAPQDVMNIVNSYDHSGLSLCASMGLNAMFAAEGNAWASNFLAPGAYGHPQTDGQTMGHETASHSESTQSTSVNPFPGHTLNDLDNQEIVPHEHTFRHSDDCSHLRPAKQVNDHNSSCAEAKSVGGETNDRSGPGSGIAAFCCEAIEPEGNNTSATGSGVTIFGNSLGMSNQPATDPTLSEQESVGSCGIMRMGRSTCGSIAEQNDRMALSTLDEDSKLHAQSNIIEQLKNEMECPAV